VRGGGPVVTRAPDGPRNGDSITIADLGYGANSSATVVGHLTDLPVLVEAGQVWAEGKTRWTRYVVVDAAKQHALESAGPADATETALG
jgi:hypothetical protein